MKHAVLFLKHYHTKQSVEENIVVENVIIKLRVVILEKSSNSTKEFYKNHSKQVRITPRVLKIVSLIPDWIVNRTVLDVGCGNKFITTCMSIYADVKGIDIEDDIRTYKDDKQYDVVTCFDILEHITDLVFALINIQTICKPGGLIIVNQPEQEDHSQPYDKLVTLKDLESLGKLIYLENYQVGKNESYNFMVFKR